MTHIDETNASRYGLRAGLAILCFIGFSITLPPLGFLMFLDFAGVVDSRRLTSIVESITPSQEVIMPIAILGYGILAAFMVFTERPLVFRALFLLLLFLVVTSIGGCAMGLNNLKGIGQ